MSTEVSTEVSAEILTAEIVPSTEIPRIKLKKAMTLEDLWGIWVSMRGELAPKTISFYASVGRYFCGFMKGKTINPETLIDWVRWLQFKETKTLRRTIRLSGEKINAINTRVKGFLKWLFAIGYLKQDLRDVIPRFAAPKRAKPEIITEREYQALKEFCKDREWCQCHLWLMILAYRTGMSLKDCCYLRWKDVHLDENGPCYIDVYRHKIKRLGDKALCQIPVIPMTDVHEWLLKLKKAERFNYKRYDGIQDYVHQDAPGLYECTFQRVAQDFRRIFTKAGLPGKHFRNFRNSMCSNLVNAGIQLALVCKITGHSNVQTLLRYLKPDREALQDGMLKAFRFAEEQSA